MNKIELIQALKDSNNLSKSEAETVINLFFNKMADALAQGERVEIIGTGFYLTRYGMFITAKHVMDDMVDWKKKKIGIGFACHCPNETEIHLRSIRSAAMLDDFDLAVCQAENYMEKYPDNPLMNMRPILTMRIPSPGESLVTFAYSENDILE